MSPFCLRIERRVTLTPSQSALPTKRENANEDGPLLSVKDMIEHCRTRHPKVWSHYGQ